MKKKLACVFSIMMVVLLCGCMTVFAAEDKSIYLSEKDGQLYYNSANIQNADKFMQINDMVPQQIYTDTLKVENKTDKEYNLHLQIVPKEGMPQLSTELLRAIKMKIYENDTLMFDGTADAIVKSGSNPDLSQLTSIGVYKPGEMRQLKVEVTLDISITSVSNYYVKSEYDAWKLVGFPLEQAPQKYATQGLAVQAASAKNETAILFVGELVADEAKTLFGACAETHWKFYATMEDQNPSSKPEDNTNSNGGQPDDGGHNNNNNSIIPIEKNPTTSDTTTLLFVIVACAAALAIGFAVVLASKKHKKKQTK